MLTIPCDLQVQYPTSRIKGYVDPAGVLGPLVQLKEHIFWRSSISLNYFHVRHYLGALLFFKYFLLPVGMEYNSTRRELSDKYLHLLQDSHHMLCSSYKRSDNVILYLHFKKYFESTKELLNINIATREWSFISSWLFHNCLWIWFSRIILFGKSWPF